MKTYSDASDDLQSTINRMLIAHHPDLRMVTVGALFVFDEESGDQVLKHQGYPAAAVVRISPLRDRALKITDAVIVVDRAVWQTLSAAQKDAVMDHELEHLERVVDEETGKPKYDALGRPKLRMRRHDHQIGFFNDVVSRHGENAMEVRSVRALLQGCAQLPLDFGSMRAAA